MALSIAESNSFNMLHSHNFFMVTFEGIGAFHGIVRRQGSVLLD